MTSSTILFFRKSARARHRQFSLSLQDGLVNKVVENGWMTEVKGGLGDAMFPWCGALIRHNMHSEASRGFSSVEAENVVVRSDSYMR